MEERGKMREERGRSEGGVREELGEVKEDCDEGGEGGVREGRRRSEGGVREG